MKPAVIYYKDIASPWICVAVYLWLLELRAAVGTDSEPIAAWLADCAAILLTLVLWTILFCLPIALAGIAVGAARMRRFNRSTVKACLVLITALHFVRWLLSWRIFPTGLDLGPVVLGAAAIGLTVLAIKQRKHPRAGPDAALPSLEECFSFGALPALVGAIALIAARVVGDQMSWPHNATASAESGQSRPNIILVVADALRAQSMSLYGYRRVTTPNLDRWARSATVYLENHANSTSTKPSMTTILTGKHPLAHGRLTKAQPPDRSGENLLRELRDHGYYVGAVTSNEDASLKLLGFGSFLSAKESAAFQNLILSWLRRYGIHPTPTGGRVYQSLAQFMPFLGYPSKTAHYGFADDTLAAAKDFVAHARKPFFLFVQVHEPHDPYEAPPSFRGMYSMPSPPAARRTLSSSHYARYGASSQSEADAYKDQCEESVRYSDETLGRFLDEIDKLMQPEESVVVITSDHGESFERGYMNHGEDLFENSTHVPLVIRFPRQERGERLSGLTQSVDIAPTLLTVAGIAAPKWMDGRALYPDQTPGTESTLTLNFKDPIGQRIFDTPTKFALWSKPYKLIQNCETRHALLYNLADDPGEKVDLTKAAPRVPNEMQTLLKGKLARQVKGPKITCALTDGQ
jgi:arylsulfatase A-like enzyme